MKDTKAFTLVELLIAMSLSVLVIGVIYLLQSSGMSTVKKGTAKVIITSEIRNKMELIVSDFRNANQILEISGDSAKIRTYADKKSEAKGYGDDGLITVQYNVERDKHKCVLTRSVNKGTPSVILTAEKINENIFEPYYERNDETSPVGWSYFLYDLRSNDSGQRALITYIRINFGFESAGGKATIITSAAMQSAHSRIMQPNWKLR